MLSSHLFPVSPILADTVIFWMEYVHISLPAHQKSEVVHRTCIYFNLGSFLSFSASVSLAVKWE